MAAGDQTRPDHDEQHLTAAELCLQSEQQNRADDDVTEQ